MALTRAIFHFSHHSNVITINIALQKGKNILQNCNLPRLETEILLTHVIQKTREYLIAYPQAEISTSQLTEFTKLCQQRAKGIPIEHLTNTKEFYGYSFFVDHNVLIPRPETEYLVTRAIQLHQEFHCHQIIEIGTGSGCISISLTKEIAAQKIPQPSIIASEISPPALQVALHNQQKLNAPTNLTIEAGDLLNNFLNQQHQLTAPYIIIANLPYIGTEQHNFVAQETFTNEPHIALFGGHNGLELYSKLFQQITQLPIQPQAIIGEYSFSQTQFLQEIINHELPKYHTKIVQDLAGLDRYFEITPG